MEDTERSKSSYIDAFQVTKVKYCNNTFLDIYIHANINGLDRSCPFIRHLRSLRHSIQLNQI